MVTEYCEEAFMPEAVEDNRSKVFLISQEVCGTVNRRRLHFAMTENPPVDILWGHSVNKTLLKVEGASVAFWLCSIPGLWIGVFVLLRQITMYRASS